MADRSKVIRHTHGQWEGIDVRRYKDGDARYSGVTRRTLVGDGQDEAALRFITRYFEVAPHGYSTLERHEHPHTVIVIRGRGRVILGDTVTAIGPLDCVYVAPGTLHQFQAGDEALGFLCIVDRNRDRPAMPSEEEVAMLRARGVPVRVDG